MIGMSEKYKLIKHNKNLAEIGNDRGVGLLFLVDEDCERKLEIIVDLLNKLYEENEQLRQKLDFYLLDEFEWKEKYGD